MLRAVRNARATPALAATVITHRTGGGHRTGRAEVDHNARTWSLVEGSTAFSYCPDRGWVIDSVTGTEKLPRDRDDWLPQGLLPFFPLALPIWGGDGDDFQVQRAELRHGQVTLGFAHMEDPKFTGTAVIDTRLDLVTEFTTSPERVSVTDIRLVGGLPTPNDFLGTGPP